MCSFVEEYGDVRRKCLLLEMGIIFRESGDQYSRLSTVGPLVSYLGPVPGRLISPNPGLKFCSTFCIYPTMHCLE